MAKADANGPGERDAHADDGLLEEAANRRDECYNQQIVNCHIILRRLLLGVKYIDRDRHTCLMNIPFPL